MATVRKSLAELKADPPKLTSATRARLESLTDDEIDAKADADQINPTWSDDMLDRGTFARSVRQAREKAGMTQEVFAARYHINVTRLRDWERARYRPDSVAAAYIKAILHNPKAIEKALAD